MTKIIGLTGGIGSGKTTIAHLFQEEGIPVYIADDAARNLMQSKLIIEKIQDEFGTAIFDNGLLNRQKLAKIVFNNPEKLKQLNAIIHPAVRIDFENWVTNQQQYPFVIYETAILFESGGYKKCDSVISVIAPQETRIERVIKRDKTTREQVLDRIKAQLTDEERSSKSDFIIENIDLNDSKKQVIEILKILKNQ